MLSRSILPMLIALAAIHLSTSFAPVTSRLCHVHSKSFLSATATIDAEAYDSYVPDISETIAIKDVVIGDGDEAKEGSMLTVSFQGRTMMTNVTNSASKFSFKLGEDGAVMEGWQRGLPGMKAGGKRLLRIPNEFTQGGGDEDLEFEVELLEVNEGPLAEMLIKNGFGANAKTYGILVLVVISAILPQLQNAGIIT